MIAIACAALEFCEAVRNHIFRFPPASQPTPCQNLLQNKLNKNVQNTYFAT